MFLIDFRKIGNVIELFFGNNKKYTGDDWNDVPYEVNAGEVYDEYVLYKMEIAFPIKFSVLEPHEGYPVNSIYCKDDFKAQKCPCLTILENDERYNREEFFERAVNNKKSVKLYFGDDIADVKAKLFGLSDNIKVLVEQYAD